MPLKPVVGGYAGGGGGLRGLCCTIILLHMNRLNKSESAIFVSLMCSVLPKSHPMSIHKIPFSIQ